MTDPWSVNKSDTSKIDEDSQTSGTLYGHSELEKTTKSLGFEDSFIANNNNTHSQANISDTTTAENHHPLPDSQEYLEGLERKLKKLKKSSNLVQALAEKRQDCLRNLVQSDSPNVGNSHNELLLELEANILNNDSTVHNLYRQLQPVQPLTVGETVHIVKYDQLEEQRLELEANEEEDDSPASR